MKASSLLFKRRISILGLCLFLIVASAKTSYKIFRWSIKSVWNTGKWIKNYFHFINAGYSYKDVYDLINSMTGREFEKFCYYLFKESGLKCKLTQASCDGGKDLILYDEYNGETYVECKRWSGDGEFKVGRPELQKLTGAAIADNVLNMLFITTGKYTNEAYEYANKMDNLELWDMKDIMKLVYKIPQERIPHILVRSLDYSNTKIIRLKPCVK
jgi:restriction system protein